MKKIYFIFLTLISFSAFAQDKKAEDPNKSPAIFVMSVNGKEYPITEGQELKLDGNFSNPSVSIKMANYKNFDNGAIAFNYKSNSTYTYAEGTGSKTWTFEGSDCVVFLFELDNQVKLDAIVTNVIAQFGKKNCKVENVSKMIGDKLASGKQINVTLAGQKLVQEYYQLELNNNNTNIIAFQNTKNDDGTLTEDGKASLELVLSTIKFGKKH